MDDGHKSDMNDIPLVERRKSPVFPPVQALALYLVSMIIGAFLIHQWTERSQAQFERSEAQASYRACVASTEILQIGNRQADVLREVVRQIIDGRRAASEIASTPEERAVALTAARRYERLLEEVQSYPMVRCNRDGTREVIRDESE